MSELETVIDELQAEPIQTDSKPIEDLLQAIQDTNFTQAERHFNDIVGDRLQDTLDQAKARIASSIGSDPEEEDEEVVDDEDDDFDFDEEEDDDDESLVAPV